MTNALPIINSLFPFTKGRLDGETKELIEKARDAFDSAEKEAKFGNIANGKIRETAGETNKNFVAIAVWHYGRGIRFYLEAFENFEKAAMLNLPPKYKKYVEKKINECLEKGISVNLQKRNLEGKYE